MVGLDEAEFAGGGGDAGLASAVDGVEGGSLGRRADGDAEVDVAQAAAQHPAACAPCQGPGRL